MLMSRVVKPGNQIESLQENPWNSATTLVSRNEIRTIIKGTPPSFFMIFRSRRNQVRFG